jgi:hypothetical protein
VSANARVVRPVFSNAVRKWFYIPTAINNYNHYMNGVDRNNKLRRNMTVYRANEHRNWRLIWHWLLDVALVNAFLVWKEEKKNRPRRGHRRFRQALYDQLLATQDVCTDPIQLSGAIYGPSGHTRVRFIKSNYCTQCKPARVQQGSHKRRFGDSLSVNVPGNGRQECSVYLCVHGTCFDSYHSLKG